jgi:predicted MFS family arabinose efflux permease
MDARLLWLALGAFAGSVESSLVVVVMPDVAAEVGISVADAGWLIFVYSLAYGIGTPIFATLFGRVDRRTVVAGAEFLFGAMALLFGLLPGYLLLLGARTFLAVGAGMFTSTAQSTAVALAAPGKRGSAISTVVMGGSIAVALGAPLAALVANTFGWRVAYVGLGVIAIVAAATMWMRLPGDIHGDTRTLRERLSVLKVPGVPLVLLAAGLAVMGSFTFFNFLAPVTTDLLGLDKSWMPVVLLAFGCGSIFGNHIGGRLADRYGGKQTGLVLGGIMIALLVALPLLPLLPEALVAPAYLVLMAVYGAVAWGFMPPQLHRLAALSAKSVQLSAALNLTAMNLGGALSAVVGGLVLENLGLVWLGPVGALISMLALVVAWIAPAGSEH